MHRRTAQVAARDTDPRQDGIGRQNPSADRQDGAGQPTPALKAETRARIGELKAPLSDQDA